MAKLEERITKLEAELADPKLFNDNPDKYNKLVSELSNAQTTLTTCEEEWLELEMMREELGS